MIDFLIGLGAIIIVIMVFFKKKSGCGCNCGYCNNKCDNDNKGDKK